MPSAEFLLQLLIGMEELINRTRCPTRAIGITVNQQVNDLMCELLMFGGEVAGCQFMAKGISKK